eukprot:264593-Rhodomonas_salina.1
MEKLYVHWGIRVHCTLSQCQCWKPFRPWDRQCYRVPGRGSITISITNTIASIRRSSKPALRSPLSYFAAIT